MLSYGVQSFTHQLTFSNFNGYTFLFILSETVRGLVVAAIFKYVDSVVESFVSCSSLILASFVVALFLNKEIPLSFYLAVGTLSIATYLYESAPEAPAVLEQRQMTPKEVDKDVVGMEKMEEETSGTL